MANKQIESAAGAVAMPVSANLRATYGRFRYSRLNPLAYSLQPVQKQAHARTCTRLAGGGTSPALMEEAVRATCRRFMEEARQQADLQDCNIYRTNCILICIKRTTFMPSHACNEDK